MSASSSKTRKDEDDDFTTDFKVDILKRIKIFILEMFSFFIEIFQ